MVFFQKMQLITKDRNQDIMLTTWVRDHDDQERIAQWENTTKRMDNFTLGGLITQVLVFEKGTLRAMMWCRATANFVRVRTSGARAVPVTYDRSITVDPHRNKTYRLSRFTNGFPELDSVAHTYSPPLGDGIFMKATVLYWRRIQGRPKNLYSANISNPSIVLDDEIAEKAAGAAKTFNSPDFGLVQNEESTVGLLPPSTEPLTSQKGWSFDKGVISPCKRKSKKATKLPRNIVANNIVPRTKRKASPLFSEDEEDIDNVSLAKRKRAPPKDLHDAAGPPSEADASVPEVNEPETGDALASAENQDDSTSAQISAPPNIDMDKISKVQVKLEPISVDEMYSGPPAPKSKREVYHGKIIKTKTGPASKIAEHIDLTMDDDSEGDALKSTPTVQITPDRKNDEEETSKTELDQTAKDAPKSGDASLSLADPVVPKIEPTENINRLVKLNQTLAKKYGDSDPDEEDDKKAIDVSVYTQRTPSPTTSDCAKPIDETLAENTDEEDGEEGYNEEEAYDEEDENDGE